MSIESAAGLSGWTRQLLDEACRSEKSVVLDFLRLLTDMIRQGTAPGRDLLCASRLVALTKPDNSIRPIAIGDLVYRIAVRAILGQMFKPEMLLGIQLGVKNPGGVEPAIFLLEEVITGANASDVRQVASLDLAKAFNSVVRKAIATAVARFTSELFRTAASLALRQHKCNCRDGTRL